MQGESVANVGVMGLFGGYRQQPSRPGAFVRFRDWCDEQHPSAGVLTAEGIAQGPEAECDVDPALSAGRAVVELAQPSPADGFGRHPARESTCRQEVGDAVLAFAESLVEMDASDELRAVHDQPRRLSSSVVGR